MLPATIIVRRTRNILDITSSSTENGQTASGRERETGYGDASACLNEVPR
jgi:hypothetical protein